MFNWLLTHWWCVVPAILLTTALLYLGYTADAPRNRPR